jgi:hypothetical protein
LFISGENTSHVEVQEKKVISEVKSAPVFKYIPC